ncbi:hypothetical protein [Paenibacillus humicola]|uniref:hypothetical protein n=1 Tax=Paenibacillus humicola TaxID=3110540 RepID=UPI00237B635D|nr:hypothetical protein [Paenibacillus humicola]
MFDPTIFENLKVAFENQLYDLDNLSRQIDIVDRTDRLEMSVMSRTFALRFGLADKKAVTGEIRLEASLQDLAAEILETPNETPGCTLLVRFHLHVRDAAAQCEAVQETLQRIWQPETPPVQRLSFVYGEERSGYSNTAELRFGRKINEDQMGDIPELVDHILRTLAELNERAAEENL